MPYTTNAEYIRVRRHLTTADQELTSARVWTRTDDILLRVLMDRAENAIREAQTYLDKLHIPSEDQLENEEKAEAERREREAFEAPDCDDLPLTTPAEEAENVFPPEDSPERFHKSED